MCRCRAAARRRIQLSDEWRYAQLATLVEAWGFRASHAREQLLSREEMAEAWFREEYEPVVAVLTRRASAAPAPRPSATCGSRMLRYLLLQTHDWTDEIVERLLGEVRPPAREDDTMVHQILKEMR